MDTSEFPEIPDIQGALPGYRLIRPLAVTAMSMVYQAEETALGRDVALKILHPNIASEPAFRERFEREVSAAVSIAHPNVIPVHAKGTQNNLHYVVMQYVDGPNLGEWIRDKGRLGLPETIRILGQIASALDTAHDKGLVHRDVKPSNILLDRRTQHAYLCDFGIAKPVDTGGLTVGGQFLGTTGYAAPEQIHGAVVGGQADQYALGCAIYQCLTGEPPFAGSDTSAVLWSHMNEPPPRVTSLAPELPPSVDEVLLRALAKRPEDRYPSCAALIEALTAASQAQAPASGGPTHLGPAVHIPQQSRTHPGGFKQNLIAFTDSVSRRVAGSGIPSQGAPVPPVNPGQRSRKPVWWLSAAAVLVLLIAGTVAWVQWGSSDGSALRARVPAPLRERCEQLESPSRTGATATLRCRDANGLTPVFDFFPTKEKATQAYDAAVKKSDVAPGTGDCARVNGSEHVYPGVDSPRGRVVCQHSGRTTRFTWIDDDARTVATVASGDLPETELVKTWNTWVEVPAFPTKDERALMAAIHQQECRRASRGTLDAFTGAMVAIECDVGTDGVRHVTAYRFRDPDQMARAYDRHVADVKAPTGVYCGDLPKGFLGTDNYTEYRLEVGNLLCYRGEHDEPVIEWTIDAMRIHYRATGDDPEKLMDWWASEGPTREELAEAMNDVADPPFPTAKEKKLLSHIPDASRVNCVRLGPGDLSDLIDDQRVFGVNCGPTEGARRVNYLQFTDLESLRDEYGGAPDEDARKCSASSSPFHGDGEYERDGEVVGWLYCDVNDDGDPYLIWTHEPLKILVLAYQAEKPKTALEWWRTQAGPV